MGLNPHIRIPRRELPCPAQLRAPDSGQCLAQRFTETLPNGVSHAVLNLMDGGPGDNTQEFTVPEGQYFFLGDNRDNSGDSRWPASVGGVGMVPEEFLIGRADQLEGRVPMRGRPRRVTEADGEDGQHDAD